MMLKNDFYIPIKLALEGEIKNYKIEFNPGASCCLALTARGYPDNKSETYQKSQGLEIMGINEADKIKGVKVFHGGTIRFEETIRVNGGRILYPTSYSENGIAQAQKLAYEAASKIYVSGGFYWRRDIADKAIKN